MKKLVIDVRTVAVNAPKTRDAEYDEKSRTIRAVERAIVEYTNSLEWMKSAAKNMSQALDVVSKAFTALAVDVETPKGTRDVAIACKDSVKKIRDYDLAAYIKALDNEAVFPLQRVKASITELKKMDTAREKAMAEYDAYRETVAKKEKEYDKKGKAISESKNYREDVARRSVAKADFDRENRRYKSYADVICKERFSAFLRAMKEFSSCTARCFTAMDKHVSDLNAVAKRATF